MSEFPPMQSNGVGSSWPHSRSSGFSPEIRQTQRVISWDQTAWKSPRVCLLTKACWVTAAASLLILFQTLVRASVLVSSFEESSETISALKRSTFSFSRFLLLTQPVLAYDLSPNKGAIRVFPLLFKDFCSNLSLKQMKEERLHSQHKISCSVF